MHITTVYSRDDGGWYAEVWYASTGATIHTTEIHKTEQQARQQAQSWIKHRRELTPIR